MAHANAPDIIDISDSDDEPIIVAASPHPVIKTSAQKRPTPAPAPGSETLVVDSTDSDDFQELEKFLGRINITKKSPQVPAKPKAGPSKPTSPTRRTRTLPAPRAKAVITLSSSDEESDSRASIGRKKIPAKKSRKPTVTKIKQKAQPSSQSKSTQAESKELAKAQAKLQNDINKLVTDKKSTIKDFTVEISHELKGQPFVALFSSKLADHKGTVSFFEPPAGVECLIRFRRRHIAQYDSALKEWVPVDPYSRLEDLYVLFLSADQLALAISEDSLRSTLAALRDSHNLNDRAQIFFMIDGMRTYYKRKGGSKVKRDVIESSMARLQATERCFIVDVDGPEDTVQWLFNMTGDLGMRPHKRIRDSFLPFCTDTKVKCGTSKSDTYKKMLQQIRGITESAADGIIEEVPTLRELFQGYAEETDANERHNRLNEVIISNRRDGAAKSRILNQALSKKVHDVMWGEDPLTLVV
ncbi:hypothetical protein BDV93DRAFT_601498 [Ceratobasidium sp. AG-I]|nr:hypothetical protein BDV93DRAFT_601498 [Ceratobasidium sp. AG-I]